MEKKIILVADDLGLDEDANRAIFHAHRRGALQGASLMMGQEATTAAVREARRTPGLEVGWHLHLTDSRPCTVSRWPWGRSPAAAGVALGSSRRQRRLVREEIRQQWTAFRETGLDCRFVNSHHHLHWHPFVRRTLVETLGEDFRGWMRWGRPRFFHPGPASLLYRLLDASLLAPHRRRLPYRLSATLWGIDRTLRMRPAEVDAAAAALGEGLHEFIFHPRREDDPDSLCLLQLERRRGHAQPPSSSGRATS